MKIILLTDDNHAEAAREAAKALKQGGIVVYPTDTLYGIGVNAFDESALARLRQLKARETKKPIAVMVPSVEHIGLYGKLTEDAKAMAEEHLPGALTIVLEASEQSPFTKASAFVFQRMPSATHLRVRSMGLSRQRVQTATACRRQ